MVGSVRKNYITYFFFYALIVCTINAHSDEEFFLRGNKSYEHKDYENALCSYDMMSKKGRAVFYNMGNCYFYKGDYAQALVYWSRAETGATRKERITIERNKKHVLQLLGKDDNNSWWYTITHFFIDIMSLVSLIILQLFFLVCWYLFIFFSRKKELKLKKMILSCLSLFIIISGLMLEIHYTRQGVQSGIVVKKEAQLFVGPDKGLQALCPIAYANNVSVKETRQGWYKIQYADMIGWVEADVVQII